MAAIRLYQLGIFHDNDIIRKKIMLFIWKEYFQKTKIIAVSIKIIVLSVSLAI